MDSLEWPTGNNFANSLSVDGVVNNLRGHKYRITSEITKNNDRFNFFKNRIAEHWNKLTNEIVGAKSTNSFKAKIDKYIKENNIYSYFNIKIKFLYLNFITVTAVIDST